MPLQTGNGMISYNKDNRDINSKEYQKRVALSQINNQGEIGEYLEKVIE